MAISKFRGYWNYGDSSISKQLEQNLVTYLNWGFLEIGAFTNIGMDSSGFYGGKEDKLYPVNMGSGIRVWQTFRSNWVYESGVSYPTSPVPISGVYVNSNFIPVGTTGSSGYILDYPNGTVIFNSNLPPSTDVRLHYSYKRVNIVAAEDIEPRILQFESLRVDDKNFSASSGIWSVNNRSRLQLPLIAIEAIPNTRLIPKSLGGGKMLVRDILCTVVSEKDDERDKLLDILMSQKDNTIILFNMNELANQNNFPLNINGDIANIEMTNYNNIITSGWKHSYIQETTVSDINNSNTKIFSGSVRLTINIDMPEL